MSVTKEYYDELYNTMIYLAGRYAPDIEILVNTINSGNRNRGVFSIKSYWFDPKAGNRLRFVDYFYENTGLAAPDAANYFFKLFCARLIVMAFYAIYLKEIFKRVDSIKKHMFANIKFGWGAKDTLWTIDSLMEAGDAEFGLETTVNLERFSLGIEHEIFIRLDNKYLLNTATMEDTLSGNMPIQLHISVGGEGEEKKFFNRATTVKQVVQQIKAVVPLWQTNWV